MNTEACTVLLISFFYSWGLNKLLNSLYRLCAKKVLEGVSSSETRERRVQGVCSIRRHVSIYNIGISSSSQASGKIKTRGRKKKRCS